MAASTDTPESILHQLDRLRTTASDSQLVDALQGADFSKVQARGIVELSRVSNPAAPALLVLANHLNESFEAKEVNEPPSNPEFQSVLKRWLVVHEKAPYPSSSELAGLVQESGRSRADVLAALKVQRNANRTLGTKGGVTKK